MLPARTGTGSHRLNRGKPNTSEAALTKRAFAPAEVDIHE
jgi:hypothetical protein